MMRNICFFLRDGGWGRIPFGLSGGRESKRGCAQQIFLMRDERYHSPCRVGTGPRWTFIASAKHNGMCECFLGEATPLTQHCGDCTAKTMVNLQTSCLHSLGVFQKKNATFCSLQRVPSSVLPS